LAKRPQVIAANKMDALYGDRDELMAKLEKEFGPMGYKIFPISAVSGEGIRELLYHVRHMLDEINEAPTIFEQEYDPEVLAIGDDPYTVEYDEEADEYVVEGPKIEKMLGYTNLESEKGFVFFQKFLKETGILDELEKLEIKEGDTVRMYGLVFQYYK
jgi:GTP-binding protein